MSQKLQPLVEQVSFERLLNSAYNSFNHQMLCISGRFVLWGSVQSQEDLRDRYLRAKGKAALSDGRRRLSMEEESEWIEIDNAATDAWNFLVWARESSGQEILREALVSYWSSFENCLKSIATVFNLANSITKNQRDRQLFIPLTQINAARRRMGDRWRCKEYQSGPKGEIFFENEIVRSNPFPDIYRFSSLDLEIWKRIGEAYLVRNAVIHTMGLATDQFNFMSKGYWAGDEVVIDARGLRSLAKDLKIVLSPFRTELTMDDL